MSLVAKLVRTRMQYFQEAGRARNKKESFTKTKLWTKVWKIQNPKSEYKKLASKGNKNRGSGPGRTQGKNHQRVNKPFLSTMLLLLLQYSYLADFDSSCWDRIQLSNRHGDEVPCKTWQEDVSHRWGPETVLLAGWDWLVRATKALR